MNDTAKEFSTDEEANAHSHRLLAHVSSVIGMDFGGEKPESGATVEMRIPNKALSALGSYTHIAKEAEVMTVYLEVHQEGRETLKYESIDNLSTFLGILDGRQELSATAHFEGFAGKMEIQLPTREAIVAYANGWEMMNQESAKQAVDHAQKVEDLKQLVNGAMIKRALDGFFREDDLEEAAKVLRH